MSSFLFNKFETKILLGGLFDFIDLNVDPDDVFWDDAKLGTLELIFDAVFPLCSFDLIAFLPTAPVGGLKFQYIDLKFNIIIVVF